MKPQLWVPVLVMRTDAERPEAVNAGTIRVVCINEQDIYENIKKMLTNTKPYTTMQRSVNSYGDVYASEQIVEAILNWL